MITSADAIISDSVDLTYNVGITVYALPGGGDVSETVHLYDDRDPMSGGSLSRRAAVPGGDVLRECDEVFREGVRLYYNFSSRC